MRARFVGLGFITFFAYAAIAASWALARDTVASIVMCLPLAVTAFLLVRAMRTKVPSEVHVVDEALEFVVDGVEYHLERRDVRKLTGSALDPAWGWYIFDWLRQVAWEPLSPWVTVQTRARLSVPRRFVFAVEDESDARAQLESLGFARSVTGTPSAHA